MAYHPDKHGRTEYGSWIQVPSADFNAITQGADSAELSAQYFASLVYNINGSSSSSSTAELTGQLNSIQSAMYGNGIYRVTGSSALSGSITATAKTVIQNIKFHLSSTPTSADYLRVQVDSVAGSAYDVVVLYENMSVTPADLVQIYEGPGLIITTGDSLVFTYTNTEAKTYGLEVIYGSV